MIKCKEASKFSLPNTLITAPKAIFCLFKYCRKSAEESFTPTQIAVSLSANSESRSFSILVIFPCASGMGSPCGSSVGLPKKSSSLLMSCSDLMCSNCSAMSCTSSQVKANFSTKKTSHKRCLRTIILAACVPFSVKETPWYLM